MIGIIIVLAFIIILLLNFIIEFLSNRSTFRKKKTAEKSLLEETFFHKYNSKPVVFSLDSSMQYNNSNLEAEIHLSTLEKLFIVNGYIAMITALESNNKLALMLNEFLNLEAQKYFNKQSLPEEKKKGKSKKETPEKEISIDTENFIEIDEIKKSIFDISDNSIKNYKFKLQRIISTSFTMDKHDEDIINMEIIQEFLITEKNKDPLGKIIVINLSINKNNNNIVKINDLLLQPKTQSAKSSKKNTEDQKKSDENLDIIDNTLINKTLFITFLSIINSLEAKNTEALLMIKNILSPLYNQIINFYSKDSKLMQINKFEVNFLYDNVYRVRILSKQQLNNGETLETEDFLDFNIPKYSFPELIQIYNNKI